MGMLTPAWDARHLLPQWATLSGGSHITENQDLAGVGGEEAKPPGSPRLTASAGAAVSNLNSHFLFYFEVLSRILGMLRRASCKARVQNGHTGWGQARAGRKNRSSAGLACGSGSGADAPGREAGRRTGQPDGWMQASKEVAVSDPECRGKSASEWG